MEKSEPALVPEWLKNSGSSSGGSSPLHSDDHAVSRVARNKSFVNGNGHDFGRTSSSDRTTSWYFRQNSSSNSSGNFRYHGSFGRNQHDRDRERESCDYRDQDRSVLGDRRHGDFRDPLGSSVLSRFEKDGLRRSQSMISGKRGDTWPNKVVIDSSSATGKNNNGFLNKGSPDGVVKRTTLKKDFPSLGTEERAVIPEAGRAQSPGISAIQSLPVGTSSSIGSEKWTSALAEVPKLVGSDGTALLSVQQTTPSSSTSVSLGSSISLNMAEAVAQGPSRAQTAPQLSVETQRLEELAIKQSRQLIPVTPFQPKASVLNSSDKLKSKVGQQQHPVSPLPANYSPRAGPMKADASKASNMGKLHILKPVREKNGVNPVVKDNLSPSGSKVVSPTLAASPSVSGSAATRGPQNNTAPDRKPALDKRPTSQAQSRNDFFNLVRKKSMANSSSAADSAMTNPASVLDSGAAASPSFSDKHAEMEVVPPTNSPEAEDAPLHLNPSVEQMSAEKADLSCNGDACDQKYVGNGKKHFSANPISSEEEEAAFLHSLGWEENNDEGGLTEEEISTFYKDLTKHINSKPPSLRTLQGIRTKLLLPVDSQTVGVGGMSSGMSSSDAKLEP